MLLCKVADAPIHIQRHGQLIKYVMVSVCYYTSGRTLSWPLCKSILNADVKMIYNISGATITDDIRFSC